MNLKTDYIKKIGKKVFVQEAAITGPEYMKNKEIIEEILLNKENDKSIE